jgi:hypothetical protein
VSRATHDACIYFKGGSSLHIPTSKVPYYWPPADAPMMQ